MSNVKCPHCGGKKNKMWLFDDCLDPECPECDWYDLSFVARDCDHLIYVCDKCHEVWT